MSREVLAAITVNEVVTLKRVDGGGARVVSSCVMESAGDESCVKILKSVYFSKRGVHVEQSTPKTVDHARVVSEHES